MPGTEASEREGARVEAELTAVLMHDIALHFFAEGTRERPLVELPFAAPVDTQPYRRMFPGGVRFGGDGAFVYVPTSVLTKRRSGTDPALIDHLVRLALSQYGAADADDDWASRVRGALRAQRSPRLVDAQVLAGQLGVTTRGLSRRLAREGVSLTELLDEALFERARALLQEPSATAMQVADALGYAELSSFFRAFRRWSGGLTPAAYRRSLQREGAATGTGRA
jgi:AraC-like DNA-binding protein